MNSWCKVWDISKKAVSIDALIIWMAAICTHSSSSLVKTWNQISNLNGIIQSAYFFLASNLVSSIQLRNPILKKPMRTTCVWLLLLQYATFQKSLSAENIQHRTIISYKMTKVWIKCQWLSTVWSLSYSDGTNSLFLKNWKPNAPWT